MIDAHVHVWDKRAPWMAWLKDRPATWDVVRRDFSWDDLRAELDATGVAELILVQACPAPEETRLLLELAARQPRVLGVVGWASLQSGRSTEADLAMFEGPGADKLVGIRNNHRWAPDGDVIATSRAFDSLRLLADRGLPLDLHFPDYTSLPVALKIVEQVPGNTYVIDHLGKPLLDRADAFAPWAASMNALSEFPNVYLKYSGWATFMGRTEAGDVQRYIDHALETFGPERILFGSNWPVALVAGSYAQTFRASRNAILGLAPGLLKQVLRTTALKCYFPGTAWQSPSDR